jgi:hypothetical protein
MMARPWETWCARISAKLAPGPLRTQSGRRTLVVLANGLAAATVGVALLDTGDVVAGRPEEVQGDLATVLGNRRVCGYHSAVRCNSRSGRQEGQRAR